METSTIKHGYSYFLNEKFRNWNPDQFNWEDCNDLVYYCSDYFKVWWDSNRWKWYVGDPWNLSHYCSEHMKLWWNPDKLDWAPEFINCLKGCCFKYKSIWEIDYIAWKLTQ